jgi:polyhydroxyalkanoate synthesis regulator phasin
MKAQGNIDIISIFSKRYKFKGNENDYEFDLTIEESYLEKTLEFTLLVEGGFLNYKALLTQEELSKYQLFQEINSIDEALEIIEKCFIDKMVIIKHKKCFELTLFKPFKSGYSTACILFIPEEGNIESTVSRLSEISIALYKDNKIKSEEINSLKAFITDMKDQMKNLTESFNNKLSVQEIKISDLKTNFEKEISELKSDKENLSFINGATSKILKEWDYEFLKTSIGSDFKLELLYSALNDGDNTSTFHSKCDGIAPTIIVIQSNYGKRFGGYTALKWDSSGSYVKGNGSNFIFSLDDKSKCLSFDEKKTIIGISGSWMLGFGEEDLFISNGCTTNDNSSSTPVSYNIVKHLGGGYSDSFTVKYLEVYKVI